MPQLDVATIVRSGRFTFFDKPTKEVLETLQQAFARAPDLALHLWWRPEDGRLDFLEGLPVTRLDLEGFPTALPSLPVRELEIRGCWEEPYDLAVIAPLPQLETLVLDCRGRSGNLKPLRGHPTLRALTLGGKVSGFQHIKTFEALRHLELRAAPKKGLPALGTLPPLESLVLSKRTHLALDGIEALAGSLQHLVLSQLQNTQAELEAALSALPGLRSLSLRSLPQLSSLEVLRCTGIRTLSLGDLPIHGVDLEPLLSCEHLWKVRFETASDRAIEPFVDRLHQRSVKVLRGHT